MSETSVLCRNATPFTLSGAFDEAAYRALMQRFVEARVGVYMATGGSGESHTMRREELRRMYEIGVEICRGKVPVYANPPEQHTARETLEHSLIAAEAGIEVVNIYGPAGKHGYKPTDAELLAHFDAVLGAFDYPVALNPNPLLGYLPKPAILAEVCRKYPQVVAINFATAGDGYFLTVKESVRPEIALYVNINGSANLLPAGASGIFSVEAMIIPHTVRRYIDLLEAGDTAGMSEVYLQCVRLSDYLRRWGPSNARWLKMAMRVLKLPGGEGGLRPPYLMPEEAELDAFAKGLVRLGIPELDEQARQAGLTN
jgi:4-hydroxy-tetrahydrodipicolinate synthase